MDRVFQRKQRKNRKSCPGRKRFRHYPRKVQNRFQNRKFPFFSLFFVSALKQIYPISTPPLHGNKQNQQVNISFPEDIKKVKRDPKFTKEQGDRKESKKDKSKKRSKKDGVEFDDDEKDEREEEKEKNSTKKKQRTAKQASPIGEYKDSAGQKLSWKKHETVLIYDPDSAKPSSKIIGFDFDSTLVLTKSGKVFATSSDDWKVFCPNVVEKLKKCVEDGCVPLPPSLSPSLPPLSLIPPITKEQYKLDSN